MKVVIVGGVAAGTKAAAKIKRIDRDTQVKILTKSQDISYAGCGLPYYVGGDILTRDQLIVNTPQKYSGLTGAEVMTGCEVTGIDPKSKKVTYRDKDNNEGQEDYDKLVIATGAVPFVPDMPGVGLKGVFAIRTPDDAEEIREYINTQNCKSAVVCGAGFVGLEVAENLKAQGLNVTIVDFADQIMPSALDKEMAGYAQRQIVKAGIRVMTGTKVMAVTGVDKADGIHTQAGNIAADIVVLAIGIRPSTAFAENTGLEMEKGAILTDKNMKTSLEDIYAAGDCAVVHNAITGKRQYSAMGSTANISARVLARSLEGEDAQYQGVLGTGVVKLLPELNAGCTGLTEKQAKNEGYDVETAICIVEDKPAYYPGSGNFAVKMIAEKATHKLLGIQVVGTGAVDKMVDIAVVGISMGAKLEDFDTLDFAYAPPFSTAIHPFVTACYVLENKLKEDIETFTPQEYADGKAADYKVIDVQKAAGIVGAKFVNLTEVNGPIEGLDKNDKLLLVCTRGKRAYLLQNRLKFYGYTNTKVLEGGVTFNNVKVPRRGGKLPADEIKRLKGLGCLQDKRYDDVFNVRVITRNGKLGHDEMLKVAEAAEKFGSGEVTMTTRLTLEIQGVCYDNLEPLFEYLNGIGLETGGTGSKVRPVVSCKGTTCQYGLIDTFDLSQKLHDLYYVGYHNVSLPHKFKIAVGGCPNNCVKPNLNDLGIIGQRIPKIDFDKCRGCKVCQVEKNCPIHVAKVVDGKIAINDEECNHCGRCVGKCPFGAVGEEYVGYKVYVGGRWGKRTAEGRALGRIFTSEQEVLDLVERAILFYRNEGISGERFADTINRLGFEYAEDKLLNGKIDKAEIMKKNVVGGATC